MNDFMGYLFINSVVRSYTNIEASINNNTTTLQRKHDQLFQAEIDEVKKKCRNHCSDSVLKVNSRFDKILRKMLVKGDGTTLAENQNPMKQSQTS